MCSRVSRCIRAAALLLAGAATGLPAPAQGFKTTIEPRGRVFPAVGPGVTALRRDPQGLYYVLAKPATTINIYKPDGTPAGQIPNANSKGAVIRYAEDFDISPEGLVLVADRGGNAIYIFSPDGMLLRRLPITAPTSVVALSGGEFAVTSLTAESMVRVFDNRGQNLRSFGNPAELPGMKDRKAVLDLGRISGDPSGRIYFAFSVLADPTIRVYDRYGYAAYEAVISEEAFKSSGRQDDRVQFGFNVGHDALADQTTSWVSFGTSGEVRFGGGVGAGLESELGRGGGFRLASNQQSFAQSGGSAGGGGYGSPYGAGLGAGGGGGGAFNPLAGTFSGQVGSQGTGFQLGMGSSGGGGRRSGGGRSVSGSQSIPDGITLGFFGSNSANNSAANTPSFGLTASDFADANAEANFLANGSYGNANSGYTPDSLYQTPGIPGAFLLGAGSNPFFHPGGFGGGFGGGGFGPPGTGGASLGTTTGTGTTDHFHRGGSATTGSASPGANLASRGPGEPHFHGHFNDAYTTMGASVKVNLGDLGTGELDKAIVTAAAVDPTSQELWAGVGDALVHFTKGGDPLSIFFLTLNGGKRLRPVALLVEPNRILVATDPWGVFEFARPDGPAFTPATHLTALPADAPPSAPAH